METSPGNLCPIVVIPQRRGNASVYLRETAVAQSYGDKNEGASKATLGLVLPHELFYRSFRNRVDS
jgi:hypothetical protein